MIPDSQPRFINSVVLRMLWAVITSDIRLNLGWLQTNQHARMIWCLCRKSFDATQCYQAPKTITAKARSFLSTPKGSNKFRTNGLEDPPLRGRSEVVDQDHAVARADCKPLEAMTGQSQNNKFMDLFYGAPSNIHAFSSLRDNQATSCAVFVLSA